GAGFQNTWGQSADAGATWASYAIYPTQFLVSATPGEGSSCSYALSRQTASIGASGDIIPVDVVTGAVCSWNVGNSPDWITVVTSGTGTATINFTAAPNTTTLPRTGVIQVGSQVLQVVQLRVDSSGSGFTDVPSTSLYFDQITLLRLGAITQGCTSTTYCPDA